MAFSYVILAVNNASLYDDVFAMFCFHSLLIEEAVYIHPDSVMSRDPLPDFVVFQEISETEKAKRPYMRGAFNLTFWQRTTSREAQEDST